MLFSAKSQYILKGFHIFNSKLVVSTEFLNIGYNLSRVRLPDKLAASVACRLALVRVSKSSSLQVTVQYLAQQGLKCSCTYLPLVSKNMKK
jgi:hypothetical protein